MENYVVLVFYGFSYREEHFQTLSFQRSRSLLVHRRLLSDIISAEVMVLLLLWGFNCSDFSLLWLDMTKPVSVTPHLGLFKWRLPLEEK